MTNPYALFKKLIPSAVQIIGTVTAVDDALKRSTVLLLGGGSVSVKGEGTIGATYLIEDGAIKTELSAITYYEVEIA